MSQKCVKITKVRIFKGFSVYWGQLKSGDLTQVSQDYPCGLSTHQLKKILPNSTQNPPFFTFIPKSSISPYFTTKTAPHQKIIHYRPPYRQIPYFTTVFPPSLTQNSTKNFHKSTLPSKLSSLFKGIFTMHYFYVKNYHSTHIFQIKNFQTFERE